MTARTHENMIFKTLQWSGLGFSGSLCAMLLPPPELQAWLSSIGALAGILVAGLSSINLLLLIAERIRTWINRRK